MMEQGVMSQFGAQVDACAAGRLRSVCRAAGRLLACAAWLGLHSTLSLHLLIEVSQHAEPRLI